MKIAYISDAIYPFRRGGAPKRIHEFSKCLARRGHEVHIFGFKWWGSGEELERDGVTLHGICNPVLLHVKGRRSMGEAVYFSSMVFPYLVKHRFDVIDCNEPPYLHCYPVKVSCLLRKMPLIITCHEVWNSYWHEYLGALGVIGKIVERNVKGLSDKLIAVTNYVKNSLIRMGVNEKTIYVVPNGVDFKGLQEVAPSLEDLDVIFVGRLVKQKKVDVLIRSISFLKKEVPDLKIGIIGDGPERRHLERLSEKVGVKMDIKFFGDIYDSNEVMSIMKSSKVFVYPTAPEGGWSLAILEANACGLPVVTVKHGKIGASAEIIKNGYNGLLVEESSPELIAEKIKLILLDDRVRVEMGKNSKNFAKEHDWEKMVDLVEKVYETYK